MLTFKQVLDSIEKVYLFMMRSVESYVEIEKRLEEISALENHDTLPHQNMLFITKHEKEKPGRMRIVQDTSYWFWYQDGLRKYKVSFSYVFEFFKIYL